MTSVACRVPDGLAGKDLWRALRTAVRRRTSKEDGRLLIDDSKAVYTPSRGLLGLEIGVLATLGPMPADEPLAVRDFVDRVGPENRGELEPELWYTGTTPLPVICESAPLARAASRFERCCRKKEVAWGLVRSVIVCARRFNALLRDWGSKGAVLGHGLAALLQANRAALHDAHLFFVIDKHGGRNNYGAMLQQALPDGVVVADGETASRSTYRVLGLKQEMNLVVEPRADAGHFCVALASMVSKYLRELLMREFNAFWQAHVPDLKPTAGYHGDSARFYEEIRPAVQRLGIPETDVWRQW
jgi:hypothetical protein